MGFDWAHTISSISKLILRSARNADNGGSGDNDSKDSQFESICSEFNQNKLMKKYQGIVVGAAASKTQAQAKRMLGAATRPRVRRESSPNGRNRTNKKSRTRRGAALKNARRISR